MTITESSSDATLSDVVETEELELDSIESSATWQGVLCVEGVRTGDGREFSEGALTWADPPIPLRWNKEDSHGGEHHTVAVNVGKIDNIWREGSEIRASGVFNLDEPDGRRAHDLVKGEFLSGVSIDADDIADADVEFIWPEAGASEDGEEGDSEPDIFDLLFGQPEAVIFHAGRIRAATLCDIPAFVEARIALTDPAELAEATASSIPSHDSATIDGTWDGAANERRLPKTMGVDVARAAYAWADANTVTAGTIDSANCRFLHHSVSADGVPGAANITACSSGIGVLNGVRGGTDIPAIDRQLVYDHLARHLRDGGQEPTPLGGEGAALVAGATLDHTPPPEWFANPRLSMPTPLMVTEDGRVYGHAALWGTCHIGQPDVCVTPPHEDAHPYFMTGEVTCADGSRVSVGQITVGTTHASLMHTPSHAQEHYEHTGVAVADVVVGNDEHGIWLAGAVRPDVAPERVRDLRASGQVSGDWRRIGGKLRLVGLLAVNVPGFPVPRVASRVASGQQLSLVAAGARSFDRGVTPEDGERLALRRILERLRAKTQGEESH